MRIEDNYDWLFESNTPINTPIEEETKEIVELKVGDKVRILRNAMGVSGHSYVGCIGTIIGIDPGKRMPFKIKTNNPYNMFWYQTEAVEPLRIEVGDWVRVNSIEWYEGNKDSVGDVDVPHTFVSGMQIFCGKMYKVQDIIRDPVNPRRHTYKLEGCYCWNFSDEMFDFIDKKTT